MKTKSYTCIICPRACKITVSYSGKDIKKIEGNSCPRGAEYVKDEFTQPKRIVTSTMRVLGSERMLAVKTAAPVPKDLVFKCVEEIKATVAQAPVSCGDVVIKDVAGTGESVVATGSAL